MLVYEMKLKGTDCQYRRLDEAIRTGRFVRNSIIRAWLDGQVKSRNDAYRHCKVLSDNPEFPWVSRLNSMARQAHAERAWASIERIRSQLQTEDTWQESGKRGLGRQCGLGVSPSEATAVVSPSEAIFQDRFPSV